MHDRSRHYRSCCHAVLPWRKRECALDRRKLVSGPAMMSGQVDQGTVKPKDSAAGCTTQPIGTFGNSVESWLHVRGRTGNDAEYLSGRGLLLQSLLRLGYQPCVLHRDDRLICKCADKLDLPLRKALDPLTSHHDGADRLPLAQQRHAQGRAELPDCDCL